MQFALEGCSISPISYVFGSHDTRSSVFGGKILNFCTILVRERNSRDLAKLSAIHIRVPEPNGVQLQ